jgi:Asp-tRNA(Asn)/Glu-tRNA(Gln) amidotransferase A subunit family amidase
MHSRDPTATGARTLIGAKSLSPVELLESSLARIDKVNAPVNAIVAMNAERAGVGCRRQYVQSVARHER